MCFSFVFRKLRGQTRKLKRENGGRGCERKTEESSYVRLIKHFSKIKEEDWKKEVELAKELRQGLVHPNIIKYCWHSESMHPWQITNTLPYSNMLNKWRRKKMHYRKHLVSIQLEFRA